MTFGHRLQTVFGPGDDVQRVFLTTASTSCHAGCLTPNATVIFLGFARPSILLIETFLNTPEYDSIRWMSSFSLPTFRAPDRGCSNKPLEN